ncbi:MULTISPECIES: RelA/SpoT family protein [Candidatus Ichthyocystis]|uniref:GTP pyrophosphokinase n=1 Tax=Candidatus Ichthyocystis hellenicum TaxID=1561003 RepID=A0A0S4M3M9_9BURK|nr:MULTISPECIES: RelA/SpoT family protein [Ichthyocystis]CUT17458.1 putative GTP pyrophosphokinase [Candidatus Ichthyocystis hellenicum]
MSVVADKKKSFFDIDMLQSMVFSSLSDEDHETFRAIERLASSFLSGRCCPSHGEDSLHHAYGVSAIISQLGFGKESVYASLLFLIPILSDDYELSLKKLSELVDPDTFSLLKGVAKVFRIKFFRYEDIQIYSSQRMNAESFRQMILALVEDIRVVVIVLSSHLQILRYLTTVELGPFHQQFAQVVLNIFAPLANRLGVCRIKWELEDLAFRFYKPELYKSIVQKLCAKRKERELFIQQCMDSLSASLDDENINHKIYGRPKNIYSIYNKMNYKNIGFSDLYDIHAIRILVQSVRDCYVVLGIVHGLWAPLPKEFDDYILQPKSNLYQSLHTVVQVMSGRNLEVQIRTFDMHQHAELGVASHWRYKERSSVSSYDYKISLLRRLLVWRDDLAQNLTWADCTQRAQLNQTIYVFTPQGQVVALPRGATPIDFAYSLHTEIGHSCRGAKVNGAIVPLDTSLDTGQRIEILTSKHGVPSRDWIGCSPVYAVTNRARSKIRQYLHQIDDVKDDVFLKGKQMLSKKIAQIKCSSVAVEEVATKFGFVDVKSLYRAVYNGDISAKMWRSLRRDSLGADVSTPNVSSLPFISSTDFSVMGVSGLSTRLSNCCHPIPSDEMMGFVTSDHCISIHRNDCPNLQRILKKRPERAVTVQWNQIMRSIGSSWLYSFKIELLDSKDGIKSVMDVFARQSGRMIKLLSSLHRDILVVHVVWETDPDRYEDLIMSLRRIAGFIRIYRV